MNMDKNAEFKSKKAETNAFSILYVCISVTLNRTKYPEKSW